MSYCIETQALSFAFRSGEPIVNNLGLQVPTGSVFGFLGPNGAGKTTTLRLLLGLLRIQKGAIRVFGYELPRHRLAVLRRLGSLIEQPSLYAHLTGRENLEIYRLTYGCARQRVDEVLAITGLTHAAGKKTKAYSLGMKQRLSIAITLLHDPELLILDEPTNGLDPAGIIETRELIKRLNRDLGKTVLVSSHLLSEMEKMATHVAIIHKGNLLFQGSLPELQQLKSRQGVVEVEVNDPEKARALLRPHFPLRETDQALLELDFEDRQRLAGLNRLLVEGGLDVYRLAVVQHDLENLFIQITNE